MVWRWDEVVSMRQVVWQGIRGSDSGSDNDRDRARWRGWASCVHSVMQVLVVTIRQCDADDSHRWWNNHAILEVDAFSFLWPILNWSVELQFSSSSERHVSLSDSLLNVFNTVLHWSSCTVLVYKSAERTTTAGTVSTCWQKLLIFQYYWKISFLPLAYGLNPWPQNELQNDTHSKLLRVTVNLSSQKLKIASARRKKTGSGNLSFLVH